MWWITKTFSLHWAQTKDRKYFFLVNITSLTWIVLLWSGNSVIFPGIQLRSTHMCTKKTNKSSGCQLTVFPRSWFVLWEFSKMSSKLKSKRLRSLSTLQNPISVHTCKSHVIWNICLQNAIKNAWEKNARVAWSCSLSFVNLHSNKQLRTKTKRSKCCRSRKSKMPLCLSFIPNWSSMQGSFLYLYFICAIFRIIFRFAGWEYFQEGFFFGKSNR